MLDNETRTNPSDIVVNSADIEIEPQTGQSDGKHPASNPENRAPNGQQFVTEEERLQVGLDPETGRFLPGNTVSRMGGRPKGSRNKLGEEFIADLYEHWQKHGISVLDAAARDKPADYLKVIASILPRDIKVSLETMSDGELSRKIDQLTQSLGIRLQPTKVTDIEG